MSDWFKRDDSSVSFSGSYSPLPPPRANPAGTPLLSRLLFWLSTYFRFVRESVISPLSVGAFFPTGKRLARLMAGQVDPKHPGFVVELGSGTGAITEALIENGVAEERLILIEVNKAFSELLQKRFPKAKIFCGDAYNLSSVISALPEGAGISAVVSGLPLRNKSAAVRKDFLYSLMECLKTSHAAAPFIQFSYAIAAPVPEDETCFRIESFPRVWLNVPPARVWVYHPQ